MSEKLRSKLRIIGSHWLGGTRISGTLIHVGLELDGLGESFYECWIDRCILV